MRQKRLLILSLILNTLFLIGLTVFIMKYYDRIYRNLFPYKHADIVVFGDSLTEGGDWSELLPGKNVLNKGTIGATTTEFVWALQKHVLNHEPKICFILGGTNDIIQGITAERTAKNIAKIAESLRSHRVIPVIESCPYSGYNSEHNKLVDSINVRIKKFSEENHIDYIDLNAMLSSNNFLNKEYTYDGIHFSQNAYPLWAEKVKAILTKYNL